MKRLSEAELEIMMIIWNAEETVTSAYVLKQLQEKKDWKKTSVLTFLTRLAEKEYVLLEKEGKSNRYTALVAYDEYSGRESKNILQKMYHNSVRNFVAALYDGDGMTQDEMKELRSYLEEKIK